MRATIPLSLRAAIATVIGARFVFSTCSTHALQPEVLPAFQLGPVSPAVRLVQGNDGYLYGTSIGGDLNKSIDDGVTWNQVDDQPSGYPHAFACDPVGNVYVTGWTGLDWVVRKQ